MAAVTSLRGGFVAHVIDVMRAWARVDARAMFGGYGLYRDGRMFALIADDTLYLKADAQSSPEFVAAGCTPFEYVSATRSVKMSYWRAPDDCLESPVAMTLWCDRAWNAAWRAARSVTRLPTRSPTRSVTQRRRKARTKS